MGFSQESFLATSNNVPFTSGFLYTDFIMFKRVNTKEYLK